MTPNAKINEAQQNRTKFPKCAEFIDEIRRVFGQDQVIVLWVEENGQQKGSRKLLQNVQKVK